jgi:hypothetical protein
MNKSWKLMSSGFILLTITALLIAGRDHTAKPAAQASSDNEAPKNQNSSSNPGNDPPASASTSNGGATAEPGVDSDHEAHVSANGAYTADSAVKPAASALSKSGAKPKVDAGDAYQQEKPTLMGLKLGMDKEMVLGRFGKAKDQFVMDEDADAITVYEYGDFSVGFNTHGELEFVDVHTPDIDPGLKGLRLGQKSEDAVVLLGKPDSNTTFVLAYKSNGTILKLDVDPSANTIQSIKLFANHE